MREIAGNEDSMLPVDLVPFGLVTADRSSLRVRKGNLKAAELLGVSTAELPGVNLADLCPEIRTFMARDIPTEAGLSLAGSEPRPFKLLAGPAADPGELLLWLWPSQQREKLLIREMKHRMKNDFLIVSSLIEMKSRRLGDPLLLADLRSRVDAIQAIHSRLSERPEILTIEIRSYLEGIAESACAAYCCGEIRVRSSIGEAEFDARKAGTLGLILNEIAINSAKHAFPDGGTAEDEFWVSLTRLDEDGKQVWCLEAGNSGPPIPDSAEFKGLGMQLIEALTTELKGRFTLTRSPSPRYRIQFPAAPT